MKKYYGETAEILTAIKADQEEWQELLGSNVSTRTLRHLGISRAKLKAIQAGKNPLVPVSAYRLASFHRHAHLGDILGDDWQGFFALGNTLTIPGIKNALTAQELRAAWVDLQTLPGLRYRLSELIKESDYVEVSATVSNWLNRLGQRPFIHS